VATVKLDVKNVNELDQEALVKVLQEWHGEGESTKVFQTVVDTLDTSLLKHASKSGVIVEKPEKSQVWVQK
jgi:hypothetical protein